MSSKGKRILILGAGFGGLTATNLLQKSLQKNLPTSSTLIDHQISIVDQKEYFMMGLVNLWILNGIRALEDSKIALNRLEIEE